VHDDKVVHACAPALVRGQRLSGVLLVLGKAGFRLSYGTRLSGLHAPAVAPTCASGGFKTLPCLLRTERI
jgi:hypothetical protein